ncbi:MAG: APC family permease [Dermabacter sp.]|nr:APC family permease [Dermabacter sp.]
MSGIVPTLKRLVVGRPFSSDQLTRERLPKRFALPAFSADTLSSLAYAPDEILLTLAVAGLGTYLLSPWVGLAVVIVMTVVVLTHRNIITEYPSGGGDFAVTEATLGPRAGRAVGASLLVDYVLTVAVSTSQAATYISGGFIPLHGHEALAAIAIIAALMVLSLRGVRDSSRLLALPVYLFMLTVGIVLIVGGLQALTGQLDQAPSAAFELVASDSLDAHLTAAGGALLVLRAFSSGNVALTGIKAVTNGVPMFRRPKAANARITLMITGAISALFLMGVLLLAQATGVKFVADPATQLARGGVPLGDAGETSAAAVPVLGQVAEAVFGPDSLAFFLLITVTTLILCIAASTAFNGFPVLASVLAKHGYLPRQLAVRGDRLAYSNGIIALAVASIAVVWVMNAAVSELIHMYIVGVFVSFAFGQVAIARHYRSKARVAVHAPERRRLRRKRIESVVGVVVVSLVLAAIILTKFADGAWVTLVAIAVLWAFMSALSAHYRSVARQLSIDEDEGEDLSRVRVRTVAATHALVIVTQLNQPAVRALAVATASRHHSVQALTVKTDDLRTEHLRRAWRTREIPVSLRIVYSPYREFTTPVVEYVRSLTRLHPHDVVVVYIPEYLVGHWWQAPLHNHALRRVTSRLSRVPGVVVTSVPWVID